MNDDTEFLEKLVEVADRPSGDNEPDPVDQPMILRPERSQPGTAQSSHCKVCQNDDHDVIEEEEESAKITELWVRRIRVFVSQQQSPT